MKMTNKKRGYPLSGKGGAFLLLALLLLSGFLALRYGSADMTFKQFIRALLSPRESGADGIILYMVRLPRVLAAILAGIGLSSSGVLLQAVTDNALAGPNIIGVNAGAGFAAVLSLLLVPSLFQLLPLFAFIGAFLATLIIVILAGRQSKTSVVLAGVAVSSLLNAFISVVTLADTDILASFNSFSVGGFSGITSERLIFPAFIIFICLIASLVIAPMLHTLCLGDACARSLGIHVGTVRLVAIICASALAAATVSFAGLLGFVGLIVPHITRRLVGTETRRLLLSSVLVGSIITVLADLLGRLLAAPSEIPVGIMMAFIGAPFFISLLLKSREV